MMSEQDIYIEKFLSADIIADLAVKALLYEVTIHPKAGLVTRISNGSHKDMNFYTFLNSSIALREYFKECFLHSEKYHLKNEDFFRELRELGKKAEQKMYEATEMINTHKGTIFSMGIIIALLSVKFKEEKRIVLDDLIEAIKELCSPLKKELEMNLKSTNGEKIYSKYKIEGARGLALSGYSLVLEKGIKEFLKFIKKINFETSCILLLFYYISALDDTNIISRGGSIETLEEIKKIAEEKYYKNIVSFDEELIRSDMSALDDLFIKKNISPGGSADLLILTIFIYFLMR